MPNYLRPALRAFIRSLLLVLISGIWAAGANPFVAVVIHLMLLGAVVIQLLFMRRRGLRYSIAFVGCLVLFCTCLSYLNQRFISQPRRYYSQSR